MKLCEVQQKNKNDVAFKFSAAVSNENASNVDTIRSMTR